MSEEEEGQDMGVEVRELVSRIRNWEKRGTVTIAEASAVSLALVKIIRRQTRAAEFRRRKVS